MNIIDSEYRFGKQFSSRKRTDVSQENHFLKKKYVPIIYLKCKQELHRLMTEASQSPQVPILKRWIEAYNTCNTSQDLKSLDLITKILLISRTCVFPITYMSGFLGLMFAFLSKHPINWFHFILALIGIILAHTSNNMTNDYFDVFTGVDDNEYIRTQYAPHPILSGLISKKGLMLTMGVVNLLDLGILIYFYIATDWRVLIFGLTGFFISFFYVAPPIKLKHIGLGELGVLIIWGPLMIGGTYFVTTGYIESWVIYASIPYGILIMTMLYGKHIDKYDIDKAKNVHTLAVIFGVKNSLVLNQILMVSFYVIILFLIAVGYLGLGTLLVFLAIPRLLNVLKLYQTPKPETPPENYPVWPLWYVSIAFYHIKLVGAFFIFGIVLDVVLNSLGVNTFISFI